MLDRAIDEIAQSRIRIEGASIFLKKPVVNREGVVRFGRERGSREKTNSWQSMRLGFENGIESSSVFATAESYDFDMKSQSVFETGSGRIAS